MKSTTMHFDNILELGDFARGYWDTTDRGAVKLAEGMTDYGHILQSDTMFKPAEALSVADQGGYWPEGASKLEPVALPVDDLLAADMVMPRVERAVTGFAVNVPAAIIGEPLSMYHSSTTARPNRLIRIGVHIGKAYVVEQEATFHRGSAILSVINALTEAGFNVELTAVWRNIGGGARVALSTVIKEADRAWSPDSVAFAFCNDSFQRRLIWAAVNRMASEGDDLARRVARDSMGTGTAEKGEDFDIYFGYMKSDQRWTKDATFKRITESARNQLALMQGAA